MRNKRARSIFKQSVTNGQRTVQRGTNRRNLFRRVRMTPANDAIMPLILLNLRGTREETKGDTCLLCAGLVRFFRRGIFYAGCNKFLMVRPVQFTAGINHEGDSNGYDGTMDFGTRVDAILTCVMRRFLSGISILWRRRVEGKKCGWKLAKKRSIF